ncbi:6-hydroxymethylpterin diphosphokinase MptE-like protein [Shewanella sp.]|uniref:motility associated factor glycosyltransferase family protein n=1 Tax=Shewanella sp. TaxID=50422 RepID=UPI003A97DAEA
MQSISPEVLQTVTVSPFGEVYFPALNPATFEKIDSKSLYDQSYKNFFQMKDVLHIVIGSDSGLLADYLLNLEKQEGSQIIVVELEDVTNLLNIEVPEEYKNYFHTTTFEGLSRLINDTQISISVGKGNFIIHESKSVQSNHIPEYLDLKLKCQKLINTKKIIEQVKLQQKIFLRNQIFSIPDNRIAAKTLCQKAKDATILLAAGGPSLDHNLEWIKANRNNLIIITISRVANKLISYGILPEIVVTVDPQKVSFDISKDMMRHQDKFLLASAYHTTPYISSQWSENYVYLGNRYPWKNEDNIELKQTTVTNSAIELAVQMGASRILLTGVDLCYSTTGKTHAKGTKEEAAGADLVTLGEWVTTYAGELVETTVQMKLAIQSLAEQASLLTSSKIINLSPHAAKIENIEHIPQDKITLEERKDDLTNVIEAILKDEHNKVESLLATKKEITKALRNITEINEQAAKALKLCQQNQHALSPEAAKKIEKIEKEINKSPKKLLSSIKIYGFSEFSSFLTSRTKEDWDDNYIKEMNSNYYQAMLSSTSELIPQLTQAIVRTQTRIDELDAEYPIEKLDKLWRQENTIGRIYSREQALGTVLNDDISLNLKNDFHELVEHAADGFAQKLDSRRKNHDLITKKIFHLKSQNNDIGLKRMVDALAAKQKDSDEYTTDFNLASAYYNIMIGNNTEALAHLLNIPADKIDHIQRRDIAALSLKLQRLDVAEHALAELQLNFDDFKPIYARVLHLNNKSQDALNTYLNFLDKYPENIPVLLNFAEFLLNVSQHTAAKTIFEQVLALDPRNPVALGMMKHFD